MIEKLEEYSENGVPNIWLIDPRLQKMFTFRLHTLQEVEDVIATDDPRLELTRAEVFKK
jgi:Uma2 family endonuclease